jgi:hypothetical protein
MEDFYFFWFYASLPAFNDKPPGAKSRSQWDLDCVLCVPPQEEQEKGGHFLSRHRPFLGA